MIASGIRKTTTNPLSTRPIHTPFLDEEVRTADCAISETWLADDILPPVLYYRNLVANVCALCGRDGALYPPAIAPIINNGSFPDTTASGSRVSIDSWERSSSQAKNRKNGRRCCVT